MNQNQQSKKERDESKAKSRTVKRAIFWLLALVVITGSVAGLIFLVKNTAKEGGLGVKVVPGLEITVTDHVKGNPNSGVVLVEYSDFQCPACRAYDPIINKVVADYGDQIAFVYRHFPLPQHFNAKLASAAAESAGRQGKFWEMKELLFIEQDTWSRIGASKVDVTLAKYAERLGLDTTKFMTDLRSSEIQNKVATDQVSGQKAGVSGTPTFFLNGQEIKIYSQMTERDFRALLDKAIAENITTNVATTTNSN